MNHTEEHFYIQLTKMIYEIIFYIFSKTLRKGCLISKCGCHMYFVKMVAFSIQLGFKECLVISLLWLVFKFSLS